MILSIFLFGIYSCKKKGCMDSNAANYNSEAKKDDGSLSWAAIRNNVRYVNIETRLGWLSQQKKMLNFIEENL